MIRKIPIARSRQDALCVFIQTSFLRLFICRVLSSLHSTAATTVRALGSSSDDSLKGKGHASLHKERQARGERPQDFIFKSLLLRLNSMTDFLSRGSAMS